MNLSDEQMTLIHEAEKRGLLNDNQILKLREMRDQGAAPIPENSSIVPQNTGQGSGQAGAKISPASKSPDAIGIIQKLMSGVGEVGKQAKGFGVGTFESLPGSNVTSAGMNTAIDQGVSAINGKPMAGADLFSNFKDNYRGAQAAENSQASETPTAYGAGKGFGTVMQYILSMGLLKGAPGMNSGGKVAQLLKTMAGGAGTNTAISQAQNPDAGRVGLDAGVGAGSELLAPIVGYGADKLKGGAEALMENAIKPGMGKFADVAGQAKDMLSEGIWGSRKGIIKQAAKEVPELTGKVDSIIEEAGNPNVDLPKIMDKMRALRDQFKGSKNLENYFNKAEDTAQYIWDKVKSGAKVTAKEANSLKKTLYETINYDRASQTLEPARELAAKTEAKGYKEGITSAVEKALPGKGAEVGALNNRAGTLLEASDAMDSMNSRKGNPLIRHLLPLLIGAGGSYAGGPEVGIPLALALEGANSTAAKTGASQIGDWLATLLQNNASMSRAAAPLISQYKSR